MKITLSKHKDNHLVRYIRDKTVRPLTTLLVYGPMIKANRVQVHYTAL